MPQVKKVIAAKPAEKEEAKGQGSEPEDTSTGESGATVEAPASPEGDNP